MKSREIAAYAVALVALIVGGLAVVRGDGDSATLAAWVQALGSVAAIIVVSLPVLIQRSIDLQQAKAATLATVNSAYDVMRTMADSYLGQGKERSEWYVPQFDVIEAMLSRCPIEKVGSTEATTAFIHFRELFSRSSAFEEPQEGQPLGSFVIYIMSNASREIETLRRLLK